MESTRVIWPYRLVFQKLLFSPPSEYNLAERGTNVTEDIRRKQRRAVFLCHGFATGPRSLFVRVNTRITCLCSVTYISTFVY
jgi:hypothetical protein